MIKTRFLIISLPLIFVLVACGSKKTDDSRNIEQIHQEEGIPVVIEEIKYQPFAISLNYNTSLGGIRETTVTSLLGDRIESIMVKVGDFVEKDQLLITFPEDNPSAQYLQAKAAFESADQTFQRMNALFAEGGISKQELDQLETMKRISQANYIAAGKMIQVRAPIRGYVTQINFGESESPGFGDPLITISQIDRYRSKIWVIERDINSVRPGMRVFARWQDQELPGRVIQVARSIDSNRQAFGVDLEFDNEHNFLLSGVMVSVDLIIYERQEAILVPRQYLYSDEQGDFVYLKTNDNADKRYIEVGQNDRMVYEIVGGLETGEFLIKEGSNLVRNGVKVRVVSYELTCF